MTPADPRPLAILIPVYNDWESLTRLLQEVDLILDQLQLEAHLYAVDDGSLLPAPPQTLTLRRILRATVVQLYRNVGHQRAIAVGLSYLRPRAADYRAVLVMDADGEDRPINIVDLFRAYEQQPDHIIVAARRKRSESQVFRTFYNLYKALFAFLVGFSIDFGNYSLLPSHYLDRLAYEPNLWNHYAATISRSRVPFLRVLTDRGTRYAGQSHMNFWSLLLHGLSGLSIYFDVITVRITFFALLISLLGGGFIALSVVASIASSTPVPSFIVFLAAILLVTVFQTVLFVIFGLFLLLNMRTQSYVVPARDALQLVKGELLWPAAAP